MNKSNSTEFWQMASEIITPSVLLIAILSFVIGTILTAWALTRLSNFILHRGRRAYPVRNWIFDRIEKWMEVIGYSFYEKPEWRYTQQNHKCPLLEQESLNLLDRVSISKINNRRWINHLFKNHEPED